MTTPRYRRDAEHERGILLGLAEHHEAEAARKEGEDRADHLSAAKACRERADEWGEIGRRAAAMRRGKR